MSLLSLVVCVSMLIGTSYAWFTDSVTSAGNVIQSGTLKVAFTWADGNSSPTASGTVWKNAEEGAIFDGSVLWEPGYVCAKHIGIANTGTLALQYWVSIHADGELEKMRKAIPLPMRLMSIM